MRTLSLFTTHPLRTNVGTVAPTYKSTYDSLKERGRRARTQRGKRQKQRADRACSCGKLRSRVSEREQQRARESNSESEREQARSRTRAESPRHGQEQKDRKRLVRKKTKAPDPREMARRCGKHGCKSAGASLGQQQQEAQRAQQHTAVTPRVRRPLKRALRVWHVLVPVCVLASFVSLFAREHLASAAFACTTISPSSNVTPYAHREKGGAKWRERVQGDDRLNEVDDIDRPC